MGARASKRSHANALEHKIEEFPNLLSSVEAKIDVPTKGAIGAQVVHFRNGKTAKNAFAVAALTNTQSNSNGTLSDVELLWLARRARGGFGIVTSCATHVQPSGQGWKGHWGIFEDEHIAGWKKAADTMHAEGALLIAQAFHAGMRAVDTIEDTAVSAVDTEYKGRHFTRPVRGLSEDEIEQLIVDFVAAAKRLDAAGVDGIELHAAHGYILTQFLCPDLNTRDDRWGGSLENRARLTREVTRRVHAAVSSEFIVGVRLSPEPGFEKAGWNMDPDENVQVAQWLAEDGVDFISVSLFKHSPTHVTAKHAERGVTKPLVQVFRDACPKDVVVMACGGINQSSDVKALNDLGFEVAVMGKTALSTPEFPKHVQADPEYKVTMFPPYAKEHLASVDVGPEFVEYLSSMGLVQK